MSNQSNQALYSFDAEQICLAMCINTPNQCPIILSSVEVDDFYFPAHKKIARKIFSLYQKNGCFDATLLLDELQPEELQTVNALVARLTMGYNPESICKIIKSKAVARRFAALLNESYQLCLEPEAQIDSIITELSENLLKLSDKLNPPSKGLEKLEHSVPKVLESIESISDGKRFISTGLLDFDKSIGGIQKGVLTVLAGRPGSGKTTVASEIALNAAQQGYKVAIFSLEMTTEQLCLKFFSRLNRAKNPKTDVSVDKLFKTNGLKNIKDINWLTNAVESALELNIWIDDHSKTSTKRIRTELTKLCFEGEQPDLVIIDYIAIMDLKSASSFSRVTELDSVLQELRAIAKDFNVALLGLAQVNRGVESRTDKRPNLGDIRESGGYEQEAAMVIGIFNPQLYNKEADPIIQLIVLKNRFGPTDTFTFGFDPSFGMLYNLA